MKAIQVEHLGGPEVLRYTDVPDPTPGPGEALIAIEAIGVNFIDVYHRKGLYSLPAPFTPGQEAAGTVIDVGAEVTAVRVGDRVAYQGILGAYAERAVVAAEKLVPLPEAVSTRTAAAMILQGITAHYLATSTYALKPGDTCLVHAAAGGVGLLLCQIAKLRGARVIGTVSTEQKAELARAAGADHVILYTGEDFVATIKRMTDGQGVDVVYDSVGHTTFDQGLDCLVPRGLMVLFGQSSGPVAPMDPQVLNRRGSLYLTRPTIAHYTATREELMQRTQDLFRWVSTQALSIQIDRELPLAEAAEAHRALETRKTIGKVLLVP